MNSFGKALLFFVFVAVFTAADSCRAGAAQVLEEVIEIDKGAVRFHGHDTRNPCVPDNCEKRLTVLIQWLRRLRSDSHKIPPTPDRSDCVCLCRRTLHDGRLA